MNDSSNSHQEIRVNLPSSHVGTNHDTSSEASGYEDMNPEDLAETASGYEEMLPTSSDKKEQYASEADPRYVGLKNSDHSNHLNQNPSEVKGNIDTDTNVAYSAGYAQTNMAYNSRPLQSNAGQGSPPQYEDIVGSNQHYSTVLYEEIPAAPVRMNQLQIEPTPGVDTSPTRRQGGGLCKFWQGKFELGVRIAILLVGFPLLVLPIVAGGFSSSAGGGIVSVVATINITYIWPILLVICGCFELSLTLTRVCVRSSNQSPCTRCVLIWDIVHSFVLGVLYWIVSGQAAWIAAIWGNDLNRLTDDSRMSFTILEIAMFSLISGFCFLMGFLYFLKGSWLIAFIARGWREKLVHFQAA